MYKDYFGLSDTPFSIAPNPHYLYMSERHREALAHLIYGINSDGGFILLTGEVGTGKTTVCRCLLEQVPDDVDMAFILNPKLTAIELLATICSDFHINCPDDASIKVLVENLNEFLLQAHRQNRQTVVIIDEAQNLMPDVLEQLRLLTNLETNERKLLQIILLGQPELLTLLARPELRQLSQRVTARFHLGPLTRQEVAEYIQHRLSVAGAKGILFSPTGMKRIYQLSNGIPRLINLICDRALLGTYVQNQLRVEVATINQAAREVLGTGSSKLNPRLLATAASVAAFLLVTYLSLPYFNQQVDSDQVAELALPDIPKTVTRIPEPIVNQPVADQLVVDEPVVEKPENSTAPLNQPETSIAAMMLAQPEPPPIYETIASLEGFKTEKAAFIELFRRWGSNIILAPESDACQLAGDFDLRCFSRLGSLREVKHLNRPVIIALQTNSGEYQFLITGITPDGINLNANGRQYLVNKMEFLGTWDGYYTLLWRIPPDYDNATTIGDAGITVDWLAKLIAQLGNTESVVEQGNPFDLVLEEKVKRFQISVGLTPDGKVGTQTWIHLNSVNGQDIPFISTRHGDG